MSESSAGSRLGNREQPLHILVVDDNLAVCEMLQEHLLSDGFVVTCARHGGSARDILKNGSVDLALIDVVMPGESGLSLADYAEGMGIDSILMTGHPESMTKLDGLAHRKIDKPFHLSALSAAIKEACSDPRRAERIP